MATASDIVANAQTQLDALRSIDSIIDAKIAAIKDAEWDKPLSSEQLGKISILRNQQQPILSAVEELSYVTMGALDKSDEINRIANALMGVIKGLNKQSDEIAAIDTSAKNIGSICTALGTLVPQIQELAKG